MRTCADDGGVRPASRPQDSPGRSPSGSPCLLLLGIASASPAASPRIARASPGMGVGAAIVVESMPRAPCSGLDWGTGRSTPACQAGILKIGTVCEGLGRAFGLVPTRRKPSGLRSAASVADLREAEED